MEEVQLENWVKLSFADYEVSDLGNLRSMDRIINYQDGRVREYKGQPIKYRNDKNGYFVYSFLIGGVLKYLRVHRLIAEIFLSNPFNLPEVNHKDGVKSNNSVSNLEWVSTKDNLKHARETGLNVINNGKPIKQLDINGNFIKEWESSAKASRELKIDATGIWRCWMGKSETCGGYKWKRV